MNINNNFTPLAWHKGDIELQSNRATYAFGHIVPLIAHYQTLIPFQIITETDEVDMSNNTVSLRKVDGTVAVASVQMGLVKVPYDGIDVLVYDGHALVYNLPIGQYYLTLTSTVDNHTNTWYSDVVTIVSDVSSMTCIEWWDVDDLVFAAGRITYSFIDGNTYKQYKNRMYFLEEIGMPEYTVEEEGEQRDGLFYSSKILSGKKYKMQIAQLTETMCDALRFVHLSDNVQVRDGYGRMYYCDSVLVTPEWQSGAVASASVEITTDTFVKQVGVGFTGDSPVIPTETTSIIGPSAIIGRNFVIGDSNN